VAERRAVLPDRRTEDEPRPTKADRRRTVDDRRSSLSSVARHLETVLPRPPAPPVPPRDPLAAVRAAVQSGRYAEAADLAAEVTTADPLCQEGHYLHGLALTNLGRDAEALVVLRKATYLAADDGFAHFLLAGALERRGEAVAAARSYRAAAVTLGARPLDASAPELDGRKVGELAALCAQQARRIETDVRRGAL
jgi:chemotaxis protein methyltransferase CheR